MEVSFVKQGAVYVAEFEVPGDFNLHLERKKGGIIRIYQRGSSQGEYDLSYTSFADDVFDHDFGALVYPKYIKVVSGSEVVSASVNFNEGGGSGNGSGEGSALRYFDTSKMELNAITAIQYFSVILKGTINDSIYFIGAGTAMMMASSLTVSDYIAICTNAPMTFETGETLTLEEVCSKYNITNEMLAVGEITKEQFYNLEA